MNTCIYTHIYSRTKNICVIGLYVFVHTLYVLLEWACVFFFASVSLFVILLLIIYPVVSVPLFLTFLRSVVDFDGLVRFVRVCMRKGTRRTSSGVNIKRAVLFTYVLQVTVTTYILSHTCIVDLVHSQEVSMAWGENVWNMCWTGRGERCC